MQETDFQDQDLARWLQEAGRRRVVRKAGAPEAKAPAAPLAPAAAEPAPSAKIGLKAYLSHPRELLLLSVAALAYLPYFYADVYVQIYSMKSVVVFV